MKHLYSRLFKTREFIFLIERQLPKMGLRRLLAVILLSCVEKMSSKTLSGGSPIIKTCIFSLVHPCFIFGLYIFFSLIFNQVMSQIFHRVVFFVPLDYSTVGFYQCWINIPVKYFKFRVMLSNVCSAYDEYRHRRA